MKERDELGTSSRNRKIVQAHERSTFLNSLIDEQTSNLDEMFMNGKIMPTRRAFVASSRLMKRPGKSEATDRRHSDEAKLKFLRALENSRLSVRLGKTAKMSSTPGNSDDLDRLQVQLTGGVREEAEAREFTFKKA